jgi:hypothetical protein
MTVAMATTTATAISRAFFDLRTLATQLAMFGTLLRGERDTGLGSDRDQ